LADVKKYSFVSAQIFVDKIHARKKKELRDMALAQRVAANAEPKKFEEFLKSLE
jgi:hypothetical protein